MKRVLTLLMISMFLFSAGIVSAKTLIAGKIYNADFSDTVYNASVQVTCNTNVQTATSKNDGSYSVKFANDECDNVDIANVFAICTGNQCIETESGDVIVGANTISTEVHDYSILDASLNIGVANVPLVPEFGAVVGVLTILSAVGVFFFVRRE